jgi:hypothetical protein
MRSAELSKRIRPPKNIFDGSMLSNLVFTGISGEHDAILE